jgi:hypothetical protein
MPISRFRTAQSYLCVSFATSAAVRAIGARLNERCPAQRAASSKMMVGRPALLLLSAPHFVGSHMEYILRYLQHYITLGHKSFRFHSYKKCACNPFRIHSYKNTGLKVPRFHTLTKNMGGEGVQALQFPLLDRHTGSERPSYAQRGRHIKNVLPTSN